MALKAIVAKLEEVDEKYRDLYVENGNGGWKLDAEGVEDVSGLKNALAAEREEKRKLKAEADKYRDLDPERAREAIQRLQELEDEGLRKDGKIDELVERRVERLRGEFDNQTKALKDSLEARDGEIGKLKGRLSEHLIGRGVLEAANKLGTPRKSAIPDIIARASHVWKLDENGEPVALDREGNKLYGKDGRAALTMEEWVEGLVKEAPHLFEASSGGGAGARQSGPAVRAEDLKNLSPQEKLKQARKTG